MVVLDLINMQMSKHVSSGACIWGRLGVCMEFQLLQHWLMVLQTNALRCQGFLNPPGPWPLKN